jgi:hypothetical protein
MLKNRICTQLGFGHFSGTTLIARPRRLTIFLTSVFILSGLVRTDVCRLMLLTDETQQMPFCRSFFNKIGLFTGGLTTFEGCDLLCPLQPKSGFLPEAGCGRPKLLKLRTGRRDSGNGVTGPLSRPSPTANLAGIWKGEPLSREVRGLQVHPDKNGLCRRDFAATVWAFGEDYAGYCLCRADRAVLCRFRDLRAWLRETLT